MTRVLVTGATGFVGRTLCDTLARSGYRVRAALRQQGKVTPPGVAESVIVGDIATTDWTPALAGVDFVIHAAARAHVVRDRDSNSSVYTRTNVEGTRRLASAAALAGVHRFIYLSSIKVNGEETHGRPFTPQDEPAPRDAYGLSKLRGEEALMEAGKAARMETVIVRSPLVYGPGVRANFAQMMYWVDKRWPLPLAAVSNARSLVSIWNLTDLLVRVLEHAGARGRTFMVSDGVDLSTPELLRLIGRSLGRSPRLLWFPVGGLRVAGRLLGVAAQIGKLCGSLQVDISDTRALLNWVPPVPIEESMARTAAAYLATRP
jgi:nucleoside-diphosphate-sugar epimerase